ncbi:hypothetical protein J2S09_000689 [Bacillus fengqiuensis]|nr:hypothetical protein [Bacillus fengqiuensis]
MDSIYFTLKIGESTPCSRNEKGTSYKVKIPINKDNSSGFYNVTSPCTLLYEIE